MDIFFVFRVIQWAHNAFFHNGRKPDDSIQRCSELMAHIVEEIELGLVGNFSNFLRFLKLIEHAVVFNGNPQVKGGRLNILNLLLGRCLWFWEISRKNP